MTNFLSLTYDAIAVGDRFASRGRTITESDVVQFCTLTGDMFVLHTDAHHAARTRFGQRIAPGLLILAYAAGLGVPSDAPAIVANYGTDALRFTAPVFIGDTIRLESEVLAKTDKRAGRDGVVRLAWNVRNQNDALVLTSDLQVLMSAAGADAKSGARSGARSGE